MITYIYVLEDDFKFCENAAINRVRLVKTEISNCKVGNRKQKHAYLTLAKTSLDLLEMLPGITGTYFIRLLIRLQNK